MDFAEVLTGICTVAGPAGFEEKAAEHAKKLLEPLVDEAWIDVMGNAIGVRRCGKEGARKLLLDAHLDEIGLIVTGMEEGFLRFATLGGLDPRVMPSACVEIMTDPPVFGVVCVQPPHVLKAEDTDKSIKIEDMYIDIGMTQEEAVSAVPIGTPGVSAEGARRFGENYFCAKAIDDRGGFATILRALELLKDVDLDVDVYAMGSTQEEVGSRGATTGAYTINADYSIVVDVGHSKTPDTKPTEVNEVLGGGVVISRGPNTNAKMVTRAIELAKEHGLKYQVDVVAGGNSGTNARAIQIARGGVATALFSIPLRYMHNPHEIVAIDDLESVAQLMSLMAQYGLKA